MGIALGTAPRLLTAARAAGQSAPFTSTSSRADTPAACSAHRNPIVAFASATARRPPNIDENDSSNKLIAPDPLTEDVRVVDGWASDHDNAQRHRRRSPLSGWFVSSF